MRMLIILVIAVALTASIAQAQDITTGLVGYWPFEEGIGTETADVSGNGHDGMLTGTPTWDSGPEGFGGGLLFDAGSSGDGVYCGTDCDPGGIFTLALWAYWNGNDAPDGTSVHFMTKSNGWATDNMRWQWELWAGRASDLLDKIGISCQGVSGSIGLSTDAMPANEWVHLAITLDGTSAALFINGIADPMGPQAFTIGTKTDAGFYIGKANTNSRSFDGYLDEARIYSRVLSVNDIQQLAAPDPDFNFPPQVDAGEYQSLLWPDDTAQLDGTVSDDGKPADPCQVTITWSKLSGPGTVVFSDTTIEDPTATFTTAGMYELRLRGYDGEKDACNVVNIYIRPDNNPIAHWDFDEGSGQTVNDDSANNNEGIRAGDSEPNWVSGWVGSGALEFFGSSTVNSYVDIATDGTIDPNLDNLRYEITLSTWIKTEETGLYIIGDSSNTWRLGTSGSQAGKVYFGCNGPSGGSLYSESALNDGYWHHIAGVYDGSMAYMYVDGVLENSAERTGLINTNDLPVTIGARYDDATTVSHSWNGMLDDVRVYSYGLSAAQVADLAAMAPLAPVVDAGEDQTFSMQDDYVQLDGTVTDDGNPVAATIEWTKTSGPGDVVFSDTAIEDPTATFSEIGTYVLRLTADDTMATIYDEVTIEVASPTCQDVIDDGLLMPVDISGPEGTPDCRIDLYDFAAFAGNWLRCNNPQDLNCEFPF